MWKTHSNSKGNNPENTTTERYHSNLEEIDNSLRDPDWLPSDGDTDVNEDSMEDAMLSQNSNDINPENTQVTVKALAANNVPHDIGQDFM